MTVYSQDQLQQMWTANGGNPAAAVQASAIMMAESGGNDSIVGSGGGGLIGLDPHSGLDYHSILGDANKAIQLMIHMSDNGSNWGPWCTSFASPGGQCGHVNPGGIQPGSAAARFLGGASGTATSAHIGPIPVPGIPSWQEIIDALKRPLVLVTLIGGGLALVGIGAFHVASPKDKGGDKGDALGNAVMPGPSDLAGGGGKGKAPKATPSPMPAGLGPGEGAGGVAGVAEEGAVLA